MHPASAGDAPNDRPAATAGPLGAAGTPTASVRLEGSTARPVGARPVHRRRPSREPP